MHAKEYTHQAQGSSQVIGAIVSDSSQSVPSTNQDVRVRVIGLTRSLVLHAPRLDGGCAGQHLSNMAYA